ncbi:MAG TPA: hypothetical protein VGH38_23005 [Bryobacteraceae bacterium]
MPANIPTGLSGSGSQETHAGVTTTNRYATIDVEMKRKAIEQGIKHAGDIEAASWRADASILR